VTEENEAYTGVLKGAVAYDTHCQDAVQDGDDIILF
jgi:hypothetical protein